MNLYYFMYMCFLYSQLLFPKYRNYYNYLLNLVVINRPNLTRLRIPPREYVIHDKDYGDRPDQRVKEERDLLPERGRRAPTPQPLDRALLCDGVHDVPAARLAPEDPVHLGAALAVGARPLVLGHDGRAAVLLQARRQLGPELLAREQAALKVAVPRAGEVVVDAGAPPKIAPVHSTVGVTVTGNVLVPGWL